MRRFFGMMPSNEIEISKDFKDKNNYFVTIQAGPNGWTILWADGGSTYKDEEHSAQENFDIAYKTAVEMVGELVENKAPAKYVEVAAGEV